MLLLSNNYAHMSYENCKFIIILGYQSQTAYPICMDHAK